MINNKCVKYFGGVYMNQINRSIGCNVTECKYHAQNEPYCSLDRIEVTHHENPAKRKESTDCHSFEPKR